MERSKSSGNSLKWQLFGAAGSGCIFMGVIIVIALVVAAVYGAMWLHNHMANPLKAAPPPEVSTVLVTIEIPLEGGITGFHILVLERGGGVRVQSLVEVIPAGEYVAKVSYYDLSANPVGEEGEITVHVAKENENNILWYATGTGKSYERTSVRCDQKWENCMVRNLRFP